MRFMILAKKNFKEIFLDYISLVFAIALPIVMLLILQTFGRVESFFNPTNLTPGIVVFGFAMISLSSCMTLARDRDSALLSRLLTAPLSANDFILAYSLPYVPVVIMHIVVLFGTGGLLGLEISGNAGLVLLILFVMSIGYIGLGMILGSVFTYKAVPIAWQAVNLLTIFSGAWFSLEIIGGGIQSIMNALPFAHAIGAARDVMVQGVGFSDIATDFYWVLGYTVVFVALGIFLFRRRMME
ncbi:MAG: ABC transporter permease [Dehalococcoidales bacterium]|nr:MAG: ABC transporter permease [Dehalococcoidales bacterium]